MSRMALRRAHTTAEACDPAKLLTTGPHLTVTITLTVTSMTRDPDYLYHQNLTVSSAAHVPAFHRIL